MTNHTRQTKIWKKQVFALVVVRVLKTAQQGWHSIPPTNQKNKIMTNCYRPRTGFRSLLQQVYGRGSGLSYPQQIFVMISWKQLEKEMIALGCIFMRQSGSHRLYIHPNYPRPIVVQVHRKSLSKATYKTIMKRIQPVAELVQYRLILLQNRVQLKSQRNSPHAIHHQSTSTGAIPLQLEMEHYGHKTCD